MKTTITTIFVLICLVECKESKPSRKVIDKLFLGKGEYQIDTLDGYRGFSVITRSLHDTVYIHDTPPHIIIFMNM